MVVAGRRAVLEAVRAGLATQVLVATSARSTQGMRELLEACTAARIEVVPTDDERLDELASDHRGAVARVRLPATLGEREMATASFGASAIVVILDGVEDPQNLGAAARSADAAGAEMLVTRTRRSAPVTPAAVRASSGALLHVPHAEVANLPRAIERLQGVGFTVVGLDASATSSVYDLPRPPGRVAVVLGAEGEGLSRLVRERCDDLVRLPMRGRVGSLNASASLAAVLYAWALRPA